MSIVQNDDWWNTDAEGHVPEYVPHSCNRCIYWTGNPGNMPDDFVCPVNIPKPSNVELEWVNGRKGYAHHYCTDFEEKKISQ